MPVKDMMIEIVFTCTYIFVLSTMNIIYGDILYPIDRMAYAIKKFKLN